MNCNGPCRNCFLTFFDRDASGSDQIREFLQNRIDDTLSKIESFLPYLTKFIYDRARRDSPRRCR